MVSSHNNKPQKDVLHCRASFAVENCQNMEYYGIDKKIQYDYFKFT